MRRITVTTAALGLCVWVAMAGQATAQTATQPVTRMFSDAQGETHTETIMMDVGQSNGFSPTGTAYFSRFAADMDLDWHPAPRRQYIVNLDAGVRITASDGESRVIGAGEVLLVEDTTGKGHLSKAVGEQIRHCIFIPID